MGRSAEPFEADVEKVLEVLQQIAAQYGQETTEYASLKVAAKAILFANAESTRQRFEEFLHAFQGELTSAQIEHLRSVGIEVPGNTGSE